MAFSKYGGALNSGGATGFGVRLLNELIEEYYCLLYTSPSPRDYAASRMPSSA